MRPNGFHRAKGGVGAFMADRFRAGDLAGVVMNDKMVNNRISSVRSEFLDALQQVTASADAIWRAQDQEDGARTGGEGEAGSNIRAALRLHRYDGKYREIEVRVKRSGVTVRARKGYLALPSSKMLIPRPVR